MIHPKSLCQLELTTHNVEASSIFFQKVFGWDCLPFILQEYYVIDVPEDAPFGISLVYTDPESPSKHTSGVLPYFRIEESMDQFLSKVQLFGGKLIELPRKLPAYGSVAQIEIPGGIRLGIFSALASKDALREGNSQAQR